MPSAFAMATLWVWCAASLLNLTSWSLTFSYDLSSALCARSSLFVTSLFAFCSALAMSFDTSSGDFDLLQPASARAATTKIGIRYSRMHFPLVVRTRSGRALDVPSERLITLKSPPRAVCAPHRHRFCHQLPGRFLPAAAAVSELSANCSTQCNDTADEVFFQGVFE